MANKKKQDIDLILAIILASFRHQMSLNEKQKKDIETEHVTWIKEIFKEYG